MGNRRGDIATLRFEDRKTVRLRIGNEIVTREGFWVTQEKGANMRRLKNQPSKTVFQPMSPMLAEILDALPHREGPILRSRYGTAYNKGSLTVMMRVCWLPQAGIARGHTLHGLRFALGATMADAEVDLKGGMEVLGHSNPAMALHYSQHADQARAAIRAIDKVTDFVQAAKSSA